MTASRSPRVLVVDDQPANLRLLSDLLVEHYTVLVARSGLKALEIAAAVPRPELILLDVMMPEISGFDVCRRLKAAPETAGIPIIFVTAHAEAEFETKGFELGAVDYISKPFHPAVVLARVRSHIDRQRKLALLETLAFLDGLTELPNRRYFEDAFVRTWRRAARDHQPVSLLMVDVDRFKVINDTHGHSAGDECLIAVARRIAAELHRADDVVARIGGEEFAVLLPNTGPAEAATLAERIRAAVAGQGVNLPFSHGMVDVTVSIGCGTAWPDAASDHHGFADAVDQRLYRAKSSGRNRVDVGGSDSGSP